MFETFSCKRATFANASFKELPIDEMDCYRKSSVWGMQDDQVLVDSSGIEVLEKNWCLAQDIPIDFVREWFFENVDEALRCN